MIQKTRHIFQWRTESGWKTIRGYVGENGALNAIRDITDQGTYRVITGDPNGSFAVVATRN